MHAWHELSKKSRAELTDGERVAIATVIKASTKSHSRRTMEQIFDEFLGDYNYLFAHCDPLPRNENQAASQPQPSAGHSEGK